MHHDYSHCYIALGLPVGSNWNVIQVAYRNLVKKWHPDRFQDDLADKKLAEEKIKEITGAYRTLKAYYRKYGLTPPGPAQISAPEKTIQSSQQPSVADREFASPPHADDIFDKTPSLMKQKSVVPAILSGAALLLIYLVIGQTPDELSSPVTDNGLSPATTTDAGNAAVHEEVAVQRFSFGSTLGEVYSAQGVPSKIEDGVWHYGKSTVQFTNGTVSSWQSHPDNPLKTAPIGTDAVTRASFFSRGSTKSDVRAIQGAPLRETDTFWEYGTSRIFFKGDRVTDWHETPLYPLKVAK